MSRRPTQENPIRGCIRAALVWLAIAGCATPAPPEPGWIEARSANFALYTALDPRGARGLLEDLELFRAAVRAMTRVRNVQPHVPTEIYAFRADSDYEPFEPIQGTSGFFRPTLRANYVALSVGTEAAPAREILYHEYVHFLVRNDGSGHYPLWFEEGFAQLLSTVDVRGDTVRIGLPPASSARILAGASRVPYSRVLRSRSYADWSAAELELFYAQSWLLAHHLVLSSGEGVSERLRRYVERVGRRVPEEQAFREAFGIEVADLAARLKKYQQKLPTYGMPRAKLAPEVAVSMRAVPKGEIRTRLGWLAWANEKPVLARRLFESALAADPNDARAIAGTAETHQFARRWDEAENDYQRALALAPDDWQSHLDLAGYLVARARVEDALRADRLATACEHLARAIALAPEIPEGHALLGIAEAARGRVDAGIASLEHALELLPASTEIELPLAQLHAHAGHRERAIALLRGVVYRAHGDDDGEAAALLESLEAESGK